MKKTANAFLMMIILILMFPFLNCSGEDNPADLPDPPDPQDTTDLHPCWSELSYLSQGRGAHMTAVVNNKIYVVAGNSSNTSVEEYNFSSNSWSEKADIATGGEWISGCAFDGKVYAIGGWWNELTSDALEVYNPATNSWESKSPMPTKRWGHAVIEVEGMIYVIGGARDWPITELYETIEIYNPQTNTWTTKAAGITPRWGLSACKANGKIYVMGGIQVKDYPPSGQSVSAMNIVEKYDPEVGVREKKSSMPTARWGLSSVTVNNKIYAIGGGDKYEPAKAYDIVEQYDPATNTWLTKSPMPKGRIGIAACELNNMIYIPGGGGITAYEAYREFFKYAPTCDTTK